MKKIYTVIIALMFIVTISEAQSLSNTTWTVYDLSNTLFKYFHFVNDTLFQSSDNVTYYPRSTYQENGNMFTIVDMQPSCCGTDTGKYTFSINNGTLDFNLISDDCPTGRSGVLVGYHWVDLNTGISSPDVSTKLDIFPNPASTILNIHNNSQFSSLNPQLIITDLMGNEVYKEKLTGIDNTISISAWSAGIYFYEVRGSGLQIQTSMRGKFVKE